MPELPEVEITRRHLDEVMRGRVVLRVEITHPRTARRNPGGPGEVMERLRGRRIMEVGRRGKFLLAPLDDGQTMVAHLGMSGRFSVVDPATRRERHTHMIALVENGVEVRFIDPRTFGFVAVMGPEELGESGVARLGPDAWAEPPDVEGLLASLSSRSAPIKAVLLDQGPLSGLGNIYADEVLFLAGVHPLRPAGEVTAAELGLLLAAVRVVLETAIEHGGTSLDDLAYLLPDGRAGENLDRLQVYGREGLDCLRCGAPVSKVVIRGRTSHFCPGCQPA